MLENHKTFLARGNDELAICGVFIPKRDSVHVGIYWQFNSRCEIVDFMSGKQILVRNAALPVFADYYFNLLPQFPHHLLPSIIAVSKAVAANALNNFVLRLDSVVYDGGEFELIDGGFKPGSSPAEKYINCGVFVMALLKSYRINILDWASFPNANPANRQYLEDWLDRNGTTASDRIKYYNQNKEIRGKHILVSPSTPSRPTPYGEAKEYSDRLIKFFKKEHIRKIVRNPAVVKKVIPARVNTYFPKVPNI